MPSEYLHGTPAAGVTLIDDVAVGPGAGVESSVLDNNTNRDTFVDLEVTVTSGSTPTSSPYAIVRLMYSWDNVTYESNELAAELDQIPIALGTKIRYVKDVFILPYYIKVYVFNSSDVGCNVTVKARTRSMVFEPN